MSKSKVNLNLPCEILVLNATKKFEINAILMDQTQASCFL